MVSAQKTILRIVSVLLIGFFASTVQAQEKATPAEHEAAIRNARITQTKALAANDLRLAKSALLRRSGGR